MEAQRKVIDCREFPTADNCGLMISGSEEEVLDAAVHHAVTRHGYPDTPDLKEKLRTMLVDE